MKAGIVIDDWKLPFFEARLKGAGFSFEKHGKLSTGTVVMTVDTEDPDGLSLVIQAAQDAAAKSRSH